MVADGPTVGAAWTPPGDRADVLVLDLNAADTTTTCRALVRRLVDAEGRVIVYTMRDTQDVALSCLDLGAVAFLTVAEGNDRIVAATIAPPRTRRT